MVSGENISKQIRCLIRSLKRMVKSVSSILLVALLTLGNLWIPVYKHTCNLFDTSEIQLFEANTCCEGAVPSGLSLSQQPCCSVEYSTIKSVDQSILEFTTVILDCAFIPQEFFSFHLNLLQVEDEQVIVSRPPPLYLSSRSLLSLIQVFRL